MKTVRYFAKVKDWPVVMDAPSISSLRNSARQYAKEMGIDTVKLFDVKKLEEVETKLKSITIKI
jgi:tetrahydromethanopterin S-methyltransferase subunit H